MNSSLNNLDFFNNKYFYTPSPHILKNGQHFFKHGVNSLFSFKFIKDLLLNKNKIVILSWGSKTNEFFLNFLSSFFNICYIEDGFYRSFNTGAQGEISLSLSIDFKQPFYHSSGESDLIELFRNKDSLLSDEIINYSHMCLDYIIDNKLTKYNNNKPLDNTIDYDKNNVLIVDQTFGDRSITKGGISEEVNVEYIITKILNSNPDANIFLKVHPETLAGDKKSALKIDECRDFILQNNVQILSDNYNPIELMNCMEEVHVLTSQMGLEALFLNKKVYCYGQPFYSKVGLTINHSESEFINKLSTIELFTLSCVIYNTHFDINGNIIDFYNFLVNLNKQK